MPWHITKSAGCPVSKPFGVVKDADGSVAGCHPSKKAAQRQLAALYANEPRTEGADVETIDQTRRTFTADQRKNAANTGAAMPDGSFPIHNTKDLKNAIHLAGNAKNPAAAKAHIKKRARALGASHMLPKDWLTGSEQMQHNSADPPRDELVRNLIAGAVEWRSDDVEDGRAGTLCGHFAKFNQWTTIDSAFEGKFLEQIAPGAFRKTIEENRAGMKCLFEHGKDTQVGNKPIGNIDVLREDDAGVYYEVALYDGLPPLVLNGLRDGAYGASFRFRVHRQKLDKRGAANEMNPDGLPERTILEAGVKEFGPVTFPAYDGATAGMRSATDEYNMANLRQHPDHMLRAVTYIEHLDSPRYDDEEDAPPETRRTHGAPASGRRGNVGIPLYGGQRRDGKPSWLLPR